MDDDIAFVEHCRGKNIDEDEIAEMPLLVLNSTPEAKKQRFITAIEKGSKTSFWNVTDALYEVN